MLRANQPIRLKGKKMSDLRARVFKRDKGCVDKGLTFLIGDIASIPECYGPLELSHDKPRSLGGEDTEVNCHCRCWRHHRLRDGHGCDLHF